MPLPGPFSGVPAGSDGSFIIDNDNITWRARQAKQDFISTTGPSVQLRSESPLQVFLVLAHDRRRILFITTTTNDESPEEAGIYVATHYLSRLSTSMSESNWFTGPNQLPELRGFADRLEE